MNVAVELIDTGEAAGEARVIPFALEGSGRGGHVGHSGRGGHSGHVGHSGRGGYEAGLAKTVSLLERAGEELLEAAAELAGGRDLEPEALFESEDFTVRQLMKIREKMMIFLWDQEVGAHPRREAGLTPPRTL
ncbi:MAG: hypothetical protein ACOC28_06605 [Alkalispirochaetaceae bacterium]